MILQKSFFEQFFHLVKSGLFVVLLITSFSACAQKATHPTVYSNSRDIDTKEMEKNILYYINQYRASKDLPALQLITEVSTQATKHSIEMATRTTPFGHDGFDERIDNIVKKIG